MQYDPIKKTLGKFFNKAPILRILFYKLLDLLLLRAWYVRREIRKWSKTTNDNIEILDAGSGFGQYSYYLSAFDNSWKILGVDVMEQQIQDCNNFFLKLNKTNVTFRIADLTLFAEKEKFDFIITVDVMEHIEDDNAVFRNFFVSMKKGGMLLISTPSDKGGSEAHSENDKSFIEEHVRNGYNIDDIKIKLQNAGFRNIQAEYSYGIPGHIAWLLSMKYPILMLGASKWFFIVLPFYFLITFPVSFILNYFDVITRHKSGTGLIIKAFK